MSKRDRARPECWQDRHDDPDNSGMCIYCGFLLDIEPGEDPNRYRQSQGWPDIPIKETDANHRAQAEK